MAANKLLLTTPTDPRKTLNFFDEKTEIIRKITVISIDYPPLILQQKSEKSKRESIFGKKDDQSALYDIAGIILEVVASSNFAAVQSAGESSKKQQLIKKVFIVANDVVFMSLENRKLISINGHFDLLPEELITNVYKNFKDLKSANLEELEEILDLSKDEVAIKAFRKLGDYFTSQNYEINNNIFNLIEHQEKANVVAKKVLLKKMVAWEIKE